LGLGGRFFLIPWEAVTVVPELEALAVDVTQETLDNAPSFTEDAWPATALPDWDAEVISFWQNAGIQIERAPDIAPTSAITETPAVTTPTEVTDVQEIEATPAITDTAPVTEAQEATEAQEVEAGQAVTTTPAVTETQEITEPPVVTDAQEIEAGQAVTATPAGELQVEIPRSVRLSVLLEYPVRNPAGEDLGELEDMMINWRDGQAAYAVLSFGGFLGLGEKWFAIPLDALILDPIEQTVIIDIEPEMLGVAPGFDQDNWPETVSPTWDEEIRRYWDEYQRQIQQALTPPAIEAPEDELAPPEEEATPSPAP
jgi:hypothetical protein